MHPVPKRPTGAPKTITRRDEKFTPLGKNVIAGARLPTHAIDDEDDDEHECDEGVELFPPVPDRYAERSAS
jgi:hypothetical protein